MAHSPAGTVTFLFTDIEGSTRLLRELRDDYARALEEHRRILRDAFSRHGGHEVDTQGDAFFYAFARARDAALAAADAQRALARHAWDGKPVRVRMALHTAEAERTAEGYVGIGVHRAARICAAAHGGQVVLSQTTHALLEEGWPDDLTARDLGEQRLKDFAEPQRLYQLAGPNLEASFPPPRTLASRRTNLPIQPTPLVGRQRELAEVRMLIGGDDVRLLTLTGPGGIGKTRLGLQVAAESLADFANGVYFVALASILDPDVILPTIAGVLGVNEAASQTLDGYLAEKELLLLLDNLEQLPEAGPRVASLLGDAPRLKVLVTSREPLHVSAERLYRVPPLELPDPRRLPEARVLQQYDAVALFVDRARAVDSRFAVTAANARAVAELCVRLDGLPLALELAAARIGLLPPDQLLARLGQRLKLLTGGARDAPERQRTLRSAIAWSHDLLDDRDRRAFARLAVFVGGWTADAAEAVCEVGIDELSSLVDKSLVRQNEGRFAMLETIREFALERLDASGEAADVRRQHAEHFLALADDAYGRRFDDEMAWSDRLEAEHDNLRAALDLLHADDRAAERRLAGALGWFWYSHSHLAEGRARLAAALDGGADRSPTTARALAADGTLAGWQGDLAAARPRLDEAIAIWRELGDEVEVALALESLAWAHFVVGETDPSRQIAEECLRIARRSGRPRLVNRALTVVGQVLVALKDVERAEPLAREALAAAMSSGDTWTEHFARHYLGDCALLTGDPRAAMPHYHRSLETAVQLGNVLETTFEMQGLAMATAGIGDLARALRVAGAADAAQRALGADLSGVAFWTELLDRYIGPARSAVGPDAAEAASREGAALGLERAIEEALSIG